MKGKLALAVYSVMLNLSNTSKHRQGEPYLYGTRLRHDKALRNLQNVLVLFFLRMSHTSGIFIHRDA